MGSFLVILFVSLAGVALTYAEQKPVAHDRLVRRCENETHPWFYGNETNSPPPWATGWLSSAESQPTQAPTFSFPHCDSVSCLSETEPTPTAGNSSSVAFAFSPEQTSLGSGPARSNQTAFSGTGQSLSSPTISPPFVNTTSVDSNTTPSPAASPASNATIPTGGNTGSGGWNNTQSNVTTQKTRSLNSSRVADTTTTSFGPIWSASGTNVTYNGTEPPWSTGGPLWSNTSFSPPGYTSPSETKSSLEFETSVITVVTIDYTPAPITPSPVTPLPEELTLTATIPETIPETWLAGWSNSSLISAVSGSLTTDGSGSLPSGNSTSDPFSTLSTPSTGNSNTTGSSSEPGSAPRTNATASDVGAATDNSTSTATSNTTVTSVASGTTDGTPTSTPTSLFWPNTTHPTPCSLPSDIWRDWNWTAPTGIPFTPFSFPGGSPSVTASPFPSSSDAFNGTYPETSINTATPSSGTWFGMTTFSNGSVATTFSTQFGTAPAATDGGPVDPNHGHSGVGVSTSAAAMKRHVVIPPRRQAGWAYAV